MPRAISISDNFNNEADYTGWTAGLYGRYDLPQFYFQGVGSYGWFDNDVSRNIDIAGADAGDRRTVRCCIPMLVSTSRRCRAFSGTSGMADSDYSSNVWAAYGEMGWKANFGTNFSFVPFAGINWHVRRQRLLP